MKRLLLTFLLLFSFSITAFATVVERVPFNDQAVRADLVVVGKAIRIETTEVHGIPFQRAIISVSEVIAGNAPGAEVAVIQPGGKRADGKMVRAGGVVLIKPGEELLLFLQRLASGDYEIVGLAQGQYQVTGEAQTGRKIIKIKDAPGQERAMTLDAAKGRARAVRANAGLDKKKLESKKP